MDKKLIFTEIQEALKVLNSGKTLLYPTDTVWGIGCDPTSESAIQKVIDIKKRPDHKAFIILVNSDAMLNRYVKDVPSIAWDIMDLATNPTTLIFQDARNLPKSICGPNNSIAIRMVKEGFASQLIHKFKKPLLSTSANTSGSNTPLSFDQITPEIRGNCDYIVDKMLENPTQTKPSSIIKITSSLDVEVIRE